jgi:hypothetical protein
MKLIGLMPVRNEDWVLACSLRAALQWCDEVIVFLHACTDSSIAIVATNASDCAATENRKRITVIQEPADIWDEMTHRQLMLVAARERGATHIAIIDADEILTQNLWRSVRDHVETLPRGTLLELPGFNVRGSLTQYHSNGIWGNRWFATAFKDDPLLHWAGDRFHARAPMGLPWHRYRPISHNEGGTLHLWGASESRLKTKHALYKITERLRWPNKPHYEIDQLYNLWRFPSDSVVMYPQQFDWGAPWTYGEIPKSWWPPEYERGIHLRAEPWQEAECRRLIEVHGRERFYGLDLFGIA